MKLFAGMIGRMVRARYLVLVVGALTAKQQLAAQPTPRPWTASIRIQGNGYVNEGMGLDLARRLVALGSTDISVAVGVTPAFTSGNVCGQLPNVVEELSVLGARMFGREPSGAMRLFVAVGAFTARTTVAECASTISSPSSVNGYTRLNESSPSGGLMSAGVQWLLPRTGDQLSLSLAVREYVNWKPHNLIRPVVALGWSW